MFIRGFFRLLYYIFWVVLIYSIYRWIRGAARRVSRPPRTDPRLSGHMVKDETCQTYLPKEEALREMIDGREYFFCSKECRTKFLEERKKTA
jgi:YHS domain-containing protein